MANTSGMFEDGSQMTANSVLILYVLELMEGPLPDNTLTELIMAPGLVNYFTMCQCLSALTGGGYVVRNLDSMGRAMYDITESGRDALSSMKYMISGGLGAAYESYIRNHKDDIKKRTRVDANWLRDSKGNYFVHCFVREGLNAVIDVTVPVADREDAETAVLNWKNNAAEKYVGILKVLLDRS
ncbi:MAG: DUF4364 family protein [Clostridia bacterium]|nr:DUF4364 family protein [Clostridia bacterium]